MRYGLIGEKLPHSFSKEIHEMLGRYEYELCPLEKTELDGFMKKHDFAAINVTIPYKTAVIPYLDFISDRARSIGAVNTVINRGGKLYGDNTDYIGLSSLIRRAGFELAGKTVVILGAGGTSKTARAVCRDMNAEKIYVTDLRPAPGIISNEEALNIPADYIINTTPCGMFPNEGVAAIDIGAFERLRGVIDVVYNPLRTKLALDCKKRGIPAYTGLYMLVSQATAAAERFLDEPIGDEVTENIYRKIRADKENTVLIGMPASGKTTIGKKLAAKTGRPFFDTDEELTAVIGNIADFINSHGEAAFRDAETEIISKLTRSVRGAVIATGGGAVLREKNADMLSANGVICFIDRDISKITPDDSRPLSKNRELLQKRYNERYGIYTKTADVTVKNDTDDFSDAAEALYGELYK